MVQVLGLSIYIYIYNYRIVRPPKTSYVPHITYYLVLS
jgi:hypothetical protein